MSCIVGPWVVASCLGPLRVNLPTKVVTVSIQVAPITLPFTTQLVFMVATVGPISTATLKVSGSETPSGG